MAAGHAGLRYVVDEGPGITRHRQGASFVYHLPGGARLRDKPTLIRVGNDEHAWQNASYGLTTLHNHHARVQGAGDLIRQ